MNLTDKITITNEDNMELMSRYPDNYFDLAIVDPPYGIGEKLTSGGTWASKYSKNDSKWDIKPDPKYFKELFRVSKNWIIWGGNYFNNLIPPSRCFIIWRKLQMLGMHTMADCELALTSFDKNAKIYDGNNSKNRIHVCQKPVKLYEWLLDNYAKEGDKILDTHLGSGSIAIACHNRKFELTACELDKDYFEASIKRIQNHINQLTIFDLGA